MDTAIAIDSRFNSNTNPVANRDAPESQMNSIIGALSRAQFQARLTEASIAYGNVSSLADLSTHPALRRRTVHTSTGHTVELPAHPVRWTDLPGMAERQSGRVPTIGEHTTAIRAEFG